MSLHIPSALGSRPVRLIGKRIFGRFYVIASVLRAAHLHNRTPRKISTSTSSDSHSSHHLPRSILLPETTPTSPVSPTRITLTEPPGAKAAAGAGTTGALRQDTAVLVTRRLQEVLVDANERGAQQLKLDKTFVEAILGAMELRNKAYTDMKAKFDGMKVCSTFCSLESLFILFSGRGRVNSALRA
jgi:hypothetical protein